MSAKSAMCASNDTEIGGLLFDDLQSRIYWATQFRNVGFCLAVVTALVSGISTYLQGRWQSQYNALKEKASQEREQSLKRSVTEAREHATELETQLNKEKLARRDRVIPEDKAIEIIESLRASMPNAATANIFILASRFDPEAIQYAAQIKGILSQAGFAPRDDGGPTSQILSFKFAGVALWMNDVRMPPPAGMAVQDAFWKHGFYFDGASVPDKLDKDTILIAVGSKPAEPLGPPYPQK